ncbi:hypothetical protein SNEBB_004122 [Seison nebaliae]|nr:hypothetical protein SNEBB_004122 [Seison nebaliae]
MGQFSQLLIQWRWWKRNNREKVRTLKLGLTLVYFGIAWHVGGYMLYDLISKKNEKENQPTDFKTILFTKLIPSNPEQTKTFRNFHFVEKDSENKE